MAIEFQDAKPLTDDERAAATRYQVDSAYFHAVSQGWSEDLKGSKFTDFKNECWQFVPHLNSAIEKFEIKTGGTVYSGHGYGMSVVGSLIAPPDRYKGFEFRYPGYTSTSIQRCAAENFVRTGVSGGVQQPVLLEINLRPGQHALPLDFATGQGGEGEYLLPMNSRFTITDAEMVRVDGVSSEVLLLHLT
jgi:hypothetical protein